MMLSIAIMAHPARSAQAEALAAETGGIIVWDERGDEWHTGRRALLEHPPAASHHLVIQDDAILVPDFVAHAGKAIATHPDAVISFYLGTSYPEDWQPRVLLAIEEAESVGAAWLRAPRLLHGVAVALPTDLIDRLMPTMDNLTVKYDHRIGLAAYAADIPILYTFPSLVDHADGPSLVEHFDGPIPDGRVLPRRAHRFGTPTDWNTPIVPI